MIFHVQARSRRRNIGGFHPHRRPDGVGPACGASATQESAATSENSSASGNFFIDPFNPYGYGRVYYNTLGYGQVYYNPFSYGQVYYNPYTIYRW
ncbi:hypothetical protein ACFQX6_17545 [Streptosporangium lutulentum]